MSDSLSLDARAGQPFGDGVNSLLLRSEFLDNFLGCPVFSIIGRVWMGS